MGTWSGMHLTLTLRSLQFTHATWVLFPTRTRTVAPFARLARNACGGPEAICREPDFEGWRIRFRWDYSDQWLTYRAKPSVIWSARGTSPVVYEGGRLLVHRRVFLLGPGLDFYCSRRHVRTSPLRINIFILYKIISAIHWFYVGSTKTDLR